MKSNIQSLEKLALLYCVISTTYLLIYNNYPNNHERNLLKSNHERNLLMSDSSDTDIDIEPEIAIGSILIWSGSIHDIPSDWTLCNGQNNTPNLTDKFVIGAGNIYSENTNGGQTDIKLTINQLPEHNHILNDDSIIIEESDETHNHQITNDDIIISFHNGHQHIISTDNISTNGEHFHNVGNYTISAEGDHIHEIVQMTTKYYNYSNQSNGTQATQNETYSIDYLSNIIQIDTSSLQTSANGDHSHNAASMYTNTAGNHIHNGDNIVANIGPVGGIVAGGGVKIGTLANYAGSHSHSVSGGTNNNGYHNHTLSGSLNISDLYTNLIGSHSHTMNGQSETNGVHKHELHAATDIEGKHTHSMNGETHWTLDNHTHDVIFGTTDSIGNGEQINIINPYYALAYIMKISNSKLDYFGAEESLNSNNVNNVNTTNYDTSVLFATTITLIVVLLICIGVILIVFGLKLYKTKKQTEQKQQQGIQDINDKEVDQEIVGNDIELNEVRKDLIAEFDDIGTGIIKDGDLIDEVDNIYETQGNILSNAEGK